MTTQATQNAASLASSAAGFLKRLSLRLIGASLLLTGSAGVVNAQTTTGTAASVQSSARPFGLDIAAPVMAAGSDTRAAAFMKELPALTEFLNKSLGESSNVDDSRMLLDPAKLKLSTASDVRVYFIGEGAGYSNTLGFNTTGTGVSSGNPALIFPNASTTNSYYNGSEGKRESWAPVLPGDFVNLGKIAGGTLLDFFLIADGANGGRSVYATDKSVNGDGINHVVAFGYQMANSPFLIIGFEDLFGGGDRDFNDLLFAVDIGAANVKALTSTPEPAMGLTLASFIGLALRRKRRTVLA